MTSVRDELDQVRKDVQRYDENGDRSIDYHDRLVDLYHFANLVQARIDDSSIRMAAGDLMAAIDVYIGLELHWSGTYKGNFWLHNDSHGASAFFPTYDKRSCFYNGDWFDFAGGTYWSCTHALSDASQLARGDEVFEWGPMLVEFTQQMNPSAPEDNGLPALVAPIVVARNVYLPLVMKRDGSSPQPTSTPTPSKTPGGATPTRTPTRTPTATPTLTPTPVSLPGCAYGGPTYCIELHGLQKNVAGVSSALLVQNEGSQSTNPWYTFYGNAGALIDDEPNLGQIEAGGVVTFSLASITGLPDGFTGYVVINANQPITGAVLGAPPPAGTLYVAPGGAVTRRTPAKAALLRVTRRNMK